MINNMYNNKIVSVIIPAYNCENYITQTISSVLTQTYKNIEIIIVDDCSTDDTYEILDKMKKTYDEIKLIHLEKNSGVSHARNVAMSIASGRYIAFLDSDDIWETTKLERQLDLLNERNAGFSYTALSVIDTDGNMKKSIRKVPKKVTYNKLLRNTVIATSTVLLDRNIIGKIEMPPQRSGQDYATWLLILRKNTAFGVKEALVKYRITPNSLSSKKLKSIKQVYNIQVKQEKIFFLFAMINTCFFVFHAAIKHFFK